MASTERSLGWATSGTGDGPAGGYDSSRWRANAQKSDGTGITLFGSYMAMSGLTTSTLTIADGAAIINGYTYETNGSVTISTSGLTGTYNVLLVANNTAGTVTVTQTGAGGTTVAASTIRAAVATTAQTSTITTAVGAANVITLGTVTVAAGTISNITTTYALSESLQMSRQSYIQLKDSIISATNATQTDFTNYASSYNTGDGVFTISTITGLVTVNVSGIYLYTLDVEWDTNTTGSRAIAIRAVSGFPFVSMLATNLALYQNQRTTGVWRFSAGDSFRMCAEQNSGGTRSAGGTLYVARL